MNQIRVPQDWVGLWYTLAHEDRGTNPMMTFLRIDEKHHDIRPIQISHERRDGLGALVELVREEGFDIQQVPQGQSVPPTGLRKRWRTWKAFQKAVENRHMEWQEWHPELETLQGEIAWRVLDAAATQEIQARAKREGVGFNAWLLARLNRCIAHELGNSRTLSWLYPVNMRGAVRLEDPLMNHSSGVGIHCGVQAEASEIQAEMRRALKEGHHWGTWWTLNIGRWVGVRGMRWLSRYRAQQNHWSGTFSCLGEWRYGDPRVIWVPCPPGTLNFPVGFACVQWFDQLAYAMKIHPAVCPIGLERVHEIEEKFYRSLGVGCGQTWHACPQPRYAEGVVGISTPS